MLKDKIRTRWPFDNWKNDGTIWEVKVNNIIWMAILGFLVGSALVLFVGFMFISPTEIGRHIGWFYRHEFIKLTGLYNLHYDSTLGRIFNIEAYNDYDTLIRQFWKVISPLWTLAYIVGFASSYGLAKVAAEPVDPLKHNRGRKLFADSWKNKAFFEIFRVASSECNDTKSFHLPFLSAKGLDPFNPSTYLELVPTTFWARFGYEIKKLFSKANQVVWFSIDRLNTHMLIFGSTRTGKSQLIKRMLHMLIRMMVLYRKHFAQTLNAQEKTELNEFLYRPFTFGQVIAKSLGMKVERKRKWPIIPKAIVYDVKGEYAREIPSSLCTYFSVHDKESARWAIGKDIRLKQHAFQFFSGWIRVDPKQPIWGESAINVGAASFVYNQTFNGTDWTLGNVAWFMSQSLEFKQKFVNQHFLEVKDTFNMSGETLGSVMGTFGAEVSPVIIQLADIYCGYYYKENIAQLSTTLLRREHNVLLLGSSLFPTETTETDGDQVITYQHPTNIVPGILIRGLVRSLNKKFPLPKTIYDAKKRPVEVENSKYRWKWDELEQLIRTKPSEYWSVATEHLTAEEKTELGEQLKKEVMSELLQKAFTESGKAEFSDFFAKLSDDFSQLVKPENASQLSKFCKPDYIGKVAELMKNPNKFFQKQVHKYFINGCLPILKNYRIWEHYETNIKDFSLREWLYDEMPEKPIVIFKSSGEFKKLNNGIIRGMSAFMTGVIDSDTFPDNSSLAVEKRRDIWIFADEFPFFGDMKISIDPIFARGASKSVKMVLASQDLAQFESEYDKEFVKFICSNVGNTLVTGANAGETAERLSNIVGKKYFTKWHVRDNGNGQSSTDAQEHEGVVITPDELSSHLGAKNGTTRTLYLGARYFDDAYIFHSPIVQYKERHKIKPALWVDGIKPNPKTVDIDKLLMLAEVDDEDDSKGGTFQAVNPSFDELINSEEEGFSSEDEDMMFAQEAEEFRKAQIAMNLAIANSIDLPPEVDEDELEQAMIAEKLIEEIFGHEIGLAKISIELIDNFMQSRKVTITPEQRAILIKYASKQQPQQPATRTQRLNIDDLYKE